MRLAIGQMVAPSGRVFDIYYVLERDVLKRLGWAAV